MSDKLQTTTNYEIFEVCHFNRDVRKLDSLKESMSKHGFISAYPLHCTRGEKGRLIVKAGHHRLECAKALKIPVFYVVTQDSASIHELERATRSWTYKDFVLSHARAGSVAHIEIVNYCKRTGISFGQATSMLAGESASSHNMTERGKDATLVLKNSDHAENVAEIVISMKNSGVTFANSMNCVNAICCVLYVAEFEKDVFCHRVASNLNLMVKQATYAQYLDLIERVYNHGARNKIPLAFMAKELARGRNAVKVTQK